MLCSRLTCFYIHKLQQREYSAVRCETTYTYMERYSVHQKLFSFLDYRYKYIGFIHMQRQVNPTNLNNSTLWVVLVSLFRNGTRTWRTPTHRSQWLQHKTIAYIDIYIYIYMIRDHQLASFLLLFYLLGIAGVLVKSRFGAKNSACHLNRAHVCKPKSSIYFLSTLAHRDYQRVTITHTYATVNELSAIIVALAHHMRERHDSSWATIKLFYHLRLADCLRMRDFFENFCWKIPRASLAYW